MLTNNAEYKMSNCKYCGQDNTHLDESGYCKKYDCFGRSGQREVLNGFLKRMSDIYTMPDTWGNVGRVVSNPYSHRHRECNNIISDARRAFEGMIPMELLDKIPMKYVGPWDKNIRW